MNNKTPVVTIQLTNGATFTPIAVDTILVDNIYAQTILSNKLADENEINILFTEELMRLAISSASMYNHTPFVHMNCIGSSNVRYTALINMNEIASVAVKP